MKSSHFKRIAIAAIAVMSLHAGNAMATPTADTLLGGFNMDNSGDATVLAKFDALSGNHYALDNLVRSNSPSVVQDSATGLWVLQNTPTAPGYFLVKFGVPKNGKLNTDQDTYFFRNSGDTGQLAFSAKDVNYLIGGDCAVGNDASCNPGRLSHWVFVADLNVVTPPPQPPRGEVPEPSTLALLAAGLAAVVTLGRRRRG